MIPSPQVCVQTEGVVQLPAEQVYPGRLPEQSFLQFQLSDAFPSSQISLNNGGELTTFPSPHFAVQTAAVVFDPAVQVNRGLTLIHPVAHPSPSSDPSSQVSVPNFFPSPQSTTHKLLEILNPVLHSVQIPPTALVASS